MEGVQSAFAFYQKQNGYSEVQPKKKSKKKSKKERTNKRKLSDLESSTEVFEPVETKKIHLDNTYSKNNTTAKIRKQKKCKKSKKTPELKPKPETKDITSTESEEELVENNVPEKNSSDDSDKKYKRKLRKNKKSEDVKKFVVWEFDPEESSIVSGKKLFGWVIGPVPEETFFTNNWEKRPLHIARHCESYYSTLLSCESINRLLREECLYFGRNVDITSYLNGERQTHNPVGRATAPAVWDFFNNGYSVRLLNPQTFFKGVLSMNTKLQEFFQCFVGANAYLTPAGTQGFAPHYDDIEAFVLQIEGKKLWKLYAPRDSSELLPSESSPNFSEDDLGPMIMEVLLEPGDLLYFPRGIIHQAHALDDIHSLHITLSMYQKNSWADFLEKLLPLALAKARATNIKFRQGLPIQYLSHIGLVNSDKDSDERSSFIAHLGDLLRELVTDAPIDDAADQMALEFMHSALPIHLTKGEKERSAYGDGERWENGKIVNVAEIGLDTRVKLIRYNAIRLVNDEEGIRIYYSVNNPRVYRAEEPQFLEIGENQAPAVDFLLKSYPDYVTVEDLPMENDDEKMILIGDMWNLGLILTEDPIGNTDD